MPFPYFTLQEFLSEYIGHPYEDVRRIIDRVDLGGAKLFVDRAGIIQGAEVQGKPVTEEYLTAIEGYAKNC